MREGRASGGSVTWSGITQEERSKTSANKTLMAALLWGSCVLKQAWYVPAPQKADSVNGFADGSGSPCCPGRLLRASPAQPADGLGGREPLRMEELIRKKEQE